MARKGQSERDPVPPLEWTAAGLGLLAVLALLFIIGGEIFTGADDDVPVLAVQIEAVTLTPNGQVAQIVVSNDSGQTAAAVQVEGKLGEQQASAVIDYVPGHSEARGGLLFLPNSGKGTIEVRVTGYELP